MPSGAEEGSSGQRHDRDPQSRSDPSNDGRVSANSLAGSFHTLPNTRQTRPAGPSDDASRTGALSQSRGRRRGYSLRRSIFSQNMEKQSATADSPIEMKRPATASNHQLESDEHSHEKKDATITITEPVREDNQRFTSTMALHQKWFSTQNKCSDFLSELKRRHTMLFEHVFKGKQLPPSPNGRRVQVNSLRSEYAIDDRTNKAYVDNTIISCRYTPWNFFPRQLVAQFGKLANFYFLCISILQMMPGLSTTGTYTTIIPLLIFVGISMAKEGYDDLKRHRLDKEENERDVCVLSQELHNGSATDGKDAQAGYTETTSTGWRTEKWQDVRVGNVVLLTRDEPVPADVILLHAKEPNSSAYIETKSLDGETNLKTKKPLADISHRCSDLDGVAGLSAEFVVADPNLDLYKFDGKVSVAGHTLPLTNNEVVYRGSTLRNTPSALGLVIYSGEECKIRMNANKTPRVKAPALQAAVNRVVVFIAALVFSIAFIMTGLYEVWRETTEGKSWYLTSARVPFGHVLTSFIIMMNTMLPLSLYVSLEIVKVMQMFLMNDIDMYDAESDTPMEPHTSTINEDLGQISYIFSDKTGTLTNNSMKFRKMSIAGTAWLHDVDIRIETSGNSHPKLLHKKRGGKGKGKANRSSVTAETQSTSTAPPLDFSSQGLEWKPSTRAAELLSCGKTQQLLEYLQRMPNSVYTRKAKFFILALALCHTCIPEKDNSGNVSFQAASPDELALVTAAQELGYLVTDRESNSTTIKTFPNGEDGDPVYEVYEVMDVIEFSSARKRMSIVIKLPDHRLCLFTKGADTTIRTLLRLADLATTTASTVQQRARQRKSLEAQQVLRRRSTQMHTGHRNSKSSLSISANSYGVGRASSASNGAGRGARESVDQWLREREGENDLSTPRQSNTYFTARQSVQHPTPRLSSYLDAKQSFTGSDSFHSTIQSQDVDELIDEGVAVSDTATFESCFQHIDDFATEGLRTLLYGYRFVSEEEYKEWRDLYASASTSLETRQEKMEAAGELIETNLELLGATAIEDKLQQGVPDTIDRFRRAGIKMWMLTGDKRETAINIGYSCRLIKNYSTVSILDQELGNLQGRVSEAVSVVANDQVAHSVLVIDGQTLTAIEADPTLKAMFTGIAISAESVICCRASPSQKASLVKTIRTKVKRSVTLAIGDGANDIAMIQEAHVGIGIAGKEGLQAARTSDYSIAQFRFLLKLLLVHGRWNYVR